MVDNYDSYQFSIQEKLRYLLEGFIVIVVLGGLFYKSILAIILLSPLVLVYYNKKRKDLVEKRRWRLNLEFRDGINSLSAALSAGYSAEHAFIEAIKDLKRMYPQGAMIIEEFTYLVNLTQMNVSVEKALSNFGIRSGIEDIINFAEVFHSQTTGGDIIKIIKTSGSIISDKLEVKRDIITMISAKNLKQP